MQVESLEQELGNWRAARRKLEEKLFTEYRADWETGRVVTVRGERYRLMSCSLADLRELARLQAEDRVIRAMRQDAA